MHYTVSEIVDYLAVVAVRRDVDTEPRGGL
jgi:hypothetical protein